MIYPETLMLIPTTWTELKPLLSTDWIECEAWAVGGGDPDNVTIKIKDGRATYESAWCVWSERLDCDRVRLARLDFRPGGIREVYRFIEPETRVLVRRGV